MNTKLTMKSSMHPLLSKSGHATGLKDHQIGEAVSFRVADEWDFDKGQNSQIHPVYPTHLKNRLAVKSGDIGLTGIASAWVRPEAVFAQRIHREPHCTSFLAGGF